MEPLQVRTPLDLDEMLKEPELEYVGFWRRAGAYGIDCLVLIAAYLPIYTVCYFLFDDQKLLDQIFDSVTNVCSAAYFIIMDSSKHQGTVGKIAMGIKIIDEDGNRIKWGKALGRYCSQILSALILFIGYIMVVFTKKKQALHDIICSTYVVKR